MTQMALLMAISMEVRLSPARHPGLDRLVAGPELAAGRLDVGAAVGADGGVHSRLHEEVSGRLAPRRVSCRQSGSPRSG